MGVSTLYLRPRSGPEGSSAQPCSGPCPASAGAGTTNTAARPAHSRRSTYLAAPAPAKVFKLPRATTSEGRWCGPSAAARVVAESPPMAEDADAPAAAKADAGLGATPFRV